MAEDFVQIAPDSTGAKIRTRSRVIGGNTVEEQYVIALQNEAVAINRGWLSTLRIPCTALGAGLAQNLFSIWNGIASGGNNVSVRRLSVEIDTSQALAGASPSLRMYRMSTQAGTPGGTVITPVQQYTAEAAINSLVATRAAHAADGVASTLTLGTIGTQPMWTQTVPRAHSLVNFQAITEYNLLPNDSNLMSVDPLILRPQEGIGITLTNHHTAALTAGGFTFMFKAVLAEFTYP